jgi:nitroreductase/NAD-dependent dihydropyrimidine dehydrogenase PreA subunit
MKFTIDQNRCTRCGLCIEECPPRIINKDKESGEVRIGEKNCLECSHCGMVCPAGAVLADGEPLPLIPHASDLAEYEIADRLIRTKRSIRHYRNAPVLQEDLDEILYTGSLTATASNSQQCEAVVLRGGEVAAATALMARELLRLIKRLTNPLLKPFLGLFGAARFADRSVVKRYTRALEKTIEGRSDPLFFHAPAVVILTYKKSGKRFGRTDCALAGAHMMLSAHARGLGSCMVGFAEIALRSKAVRQKLGIPKDRQVGLVFTLGYSGQKYYRYPLRKSWPKI